MKKSVDTVINYRFTQAEIKDLIRRHTAAVIPHDDNEQPVEISGLAHDGMLISVTYFEAKGEPGIDTRVERKGCLHYWTLTGRSAIVNGKCEMCGQETIAASKFIVGGAYDTSVASTPTSKGVENG